MSKLLKKLFYTYYKNIDAGKLLPRDFKSREIGVMLWDTRGMIRHKGFLEKSELSNFIITNAPRHFYHSASLYRSPWIDKMALKGYFGCDLVFDIDCDHIDTPCKEKHDSWKCKQCGLEGNGLHPKICPECNHAVFESRGWLCDTCLEKSKSETKKLVEDFLNYDFGIPLDQLHIIFSGHRGYHVHVLNDAFRQLSSESRRELCDFITGTGISLPQIGLSVGSKMINGFTLDDTGWRERIVKYLLQAVQDIKKGKNSLGFEKILVTCLSHNAEVLMERIINKKRNWTMEKVAMGYWTKIIHHLISEARCEIDVPVTIDTHRLIRAPHSLHGRTGFKVVPLAWDELDDFDPFSDPIVFKGKEAMFSTTQKVKEIRIGEETYGPFEENTQVKIPLEAAVFLACKGVGVLS